MKPKKIDPFVNGFTGKMASGTAAGARTTGLASRQISKPLGNAAVRGAQAGIAGKQMIKDTPNTITRPVKNTIKDTPNTMFRADPLVQSTAKVYNRKKK